MAAPNQQFDAVTLEVLWTRLISVVDEAAKALTRAAFSTLVNESNDFACVITDVRGQSLIQNTDSIPSFIGSLPVTVKTMIKEIGIENMKPGDVLTTNNPWIATGHLNDVSVVKPVFRGGQVVAFAASTAHVPDIGGKIRSIEPREVFEEGFHIPPLKMFFEGEPNETFFKLLRAAVRTPDQTVGDLYAQITGLDLMEKRLLDLMEDYGLDNLSELSDEIHGRCERAMRAAIHDIPDGAYAYEFQTDGLEEPSTLKMKLTVAGEEIEVDFTGSSPQRDRAINCTMTYTFAMTVYALKAALLPHVPNNEGIFRPIRVVAPEGSIVNPTFPVAVGGRICTGHYIPVLVFGALSKIMPDRVIAGAGSPLWSIIQTGVRDDGGTYANVFFFSGGMGALNDQDGQSTFCWPSNISNVPVEMMERNSPLFIRHKKLRPSTGGPGKHRGGLGQDILFENESKSAIAMIFIAERTKFAAPGMFGGEPGGFGRVEIDGEVIDDRLLHVLNEGQTIRLCVPGGGGFGAASERDPTLTEADRLMGYVTI